MISCRAVAGSRSGTVQSNRAYLNCQSGNPLHKVVNGMPIEGDRL